MSAKAVYVASPYSDTFIDFAKILGHGGEQNWRVSLSVYVCTQSGAIMTISPLGRSRMKAYLVLQQYLLICELIREFESAKL